MALDDQLAFGLARLAAHARHVTWQAGEREGLTPTQAEALDLVARRDEGIRLTALATHIQVSQPTASDVVSALVRKGLLARHADPTDGRATILRATREGESLVARWPVGFATSIALLSEDRRELLLGLVMETVSALVETGAIPPQRMCRTCRFFARDVHPGSARPHHCRFVDLPLASGDLRIDCTEHQQQVQPVGRPF